MNSGLIDRETIRMQSRKLVSVNWHLWPRCMNNCSFCFGRFNEIKTTLNRENALRILRILVDSGTEKISFTGGEPLLCPHLGELIKESHNLGLTTMLITSGTILNTKFIEEHHRYLDWIALSVDSSNEHIQKQLGRGNGNHVHKIKKLSKDIHSYNINLKINTVVTKLNWNEDMTEFIEEIAPVRWKVFQVLKIVGQNDGTIDQLLISEEEFNVFVKTHNHLKPVVESNKDMKGSYIMLDALGRFFQNSNGYLQYSQSILEIDPIKAIIQVGWDYNKFIKRGGLYNWNIKGGG
ncbi:MAG: viperin family antiviral radical SAM protein [Candidatus Heimdallarchaeum aukensis]|uniref:Viperin family antiviral radical SAM protein n=1 Tax=Candidatus Heimdallarchaeum aukensis TaxID=2876573 RepID=A0A9Y1BKA0_9ARCH|nr:MAG: viperin family antiviral radical SAM protein [Candidatus Heimdallarchaeum aukensis]